MVKKMKRSTLLGSDNIGKESISKKKKSANKWKIPG